MTTYDRFSPFKVMLNQAGFFADSKKMASLAFACDSFQVKNENDEVCFEGKTQCMGEDQASKDVVYRCDFSELAVEGKYYVCAGGEKSAMFEIGEKVYDKLFYDINKAFYYLRCGCGLDEKYAGVYAHGTCHTGKAVLWEDRSVSFEATGGWHDAGDYGRYITAGACAVGHLLYAYKMFPEVLNKLELNIPESGSGVPDFLSECRYELEWFLKMQAENGGVYHKLTTQRHAPFVMPEMDQEQLYAFPISSIATADFAAACALAAEVYEKIDEAFSKKLSEAAKKAYGWLNANPDAVLFKNPPESNTGEYSEADDNSNRFWVAAQMYSLTGEKCYEEDMRALLNRDFPHTQMGYGEIAGLGELAYLLTSQEKAADLESMMLEDLQMEAKKLADLADACGYGVAMRMSDYCWGSNMNVMKNAMVFAAADYFTKKMGVSPAFPVAYRDYAAAQLDYLMGNNAMSISYVTGTGDFRCNYPHLRPSDQDGIEECIPGMVSGGPNGRPADAVGIELIPAGTPPMKCYLDHVDCYSLNEITIYWNSPAVFALAYLLTK